MESDDFTPPTRESMSDEDLANLVKGSQSDEAGILYAMEVLSQQSKLRQQDEEKFAAWVAKLEADGSPEALLAVENAKRAQGGEAPLEAHEFTPAPISSSDVADPQVVESPEDDIAVEEPEIVDDQVSEHLEEPEAEAQAGPEQPQEAEELEHDLAPLPTNHEWDDVVDVEVDLHTGVAVTDFDAILNTESSSDGIEPEDFEIYETPATAALAKQAKGNHPSSQFWSWLGLTSGVLPIGLGFLLHSFGLTGLQAFVALVAGVAASAIVISVGAVAGKRSGLPTLVISRSTFGVFGNLVPGIPLVVVRFAFTAVLALAGLQLLANHVGFKLTDPLVEGVSSGYLSVALAVLFVLFALAATVSALGDRVTYRVQQVVGIVALAAPIYVAIQSKLEWTKLWQVTDASWWSVLAASLLIFAGFGGVWSSSSADFARGIGTRASGFWVFSFAKLGLVVLPIVSGSLGILLAEAQPNFGGDLISATVTGAIPQLALTGILSLSLVTWLAMSLASVGFGFNGLGVKAASAWLQPVLGVAALALAFSLFVNGVSAWSLVRDYLAFAGVPLLAWTGLFVSEVLIRRIAYHEVSLQRSYGIYKSINWVTVIGFLVAVAAGWGYIHSEANGLGWVGYLVSVSGDFAFWHETQLGLGVAFLVGLVVPVLFGIPRIKHQEAEVLAIENRRNELNDVTY